MKKCLLLLLYCFISYSAFSQWAPYCTSRSTSTSDDENIGNVSFSTINNTTICGSFAGTQGTGIGEIVNGYVHYTNFTNSTVPVPILTFGSTYTLSVTVLQCSGGNYPNSGKVFIDWNQDFDFLDAGEDFIIFNNASGAHTKTVNIPIPPTATVGLTRMRVSVFETSNVNNILPCSINFGWGEVEDYNIFVGKKIFDFTPVQVISPDTISFCADQAIPFDLKIKNIGNQPIDQAKVDLYIKGINGSSTNIKKTVAFTTKVLPNQDYVVSFDEITFPNDEMLEFTFITNSLVDTNFSNDTLKKYIQVYKTPTFKLITDSVCTGNFAQVAISNLSKPSYFLWDNQSIDSTTSYLSVSSDTTTQFKFKRVNLTVSRGWKCNKDTFLNIRINPLPTLKLSNDTTLCAGQSTLLNAISDANTFLWNGASTGATSTINSLSVNAINDVYTVMATHSATGCFRIDSVKVGGVVPTPLIKVNDTTCLGDIVHVGLVTADSNYTYYWKAKNAYTPMIYDTPSVNTTYTIDWFYKKCHDKTTVSSKVNPLPTVKATAQTQHLCQGYSTTIAASGASKYVWNNGSTNASQVVSPKQLTYYYVTGTDVNGCIGTSKIDVHLHKPNVEVYSNKYFNNVCNGDSATLFSTGAKSYVWNQGLSNDSIHKVIPSQSTDYTVIGTDNFGCKDTTIFRLSVRPTFKVTTEQDKIGCTGDTVRIWASGGKGATYKWGGTLGKDSFAYVILANSTNYSVSVTSADSCQVIKTVPVKVLPKPVARCSDASTCAGLSTTIEASGGTYYEWSTGSQGSTITASPSVTTEYKVTVKNDAGCEDVAIGTIFIINPDTIKFKTPIDSYVCPSIPVTLIATPYGGVWDGIYVTNNTWNIKNIKDTLATVTYIYLDPINGCEQRKSKTIKINHDCSIYSHIAGVLDENEWNVYPNPFDNYVTIEIHSPANEDATISLYDFSGRKLITRMEHLKRGINKFEISNLNLATGTYYIELETEHVNRQMKLIKQ